MSEIQKRMLPPERVPHVVGFIVVLLIGAFLLHVPALILIPVWAVFFWFICEPVDDD